MRIALTGGSGFIGSTLVRACVAGGIPVRALVRSPEAERRLRSQGAQTIRGCLGGGRAPARLLEEGDCLIHAAARVSMTGPWRSFLADTVETTRDLLDAVLPRRPSRVVYVSSGAVYAVRGGRAGPVGRSGGVHPHHRNPYGRAKHAAESLVRTRCDAARCSWTIVRLGFVYGPGNRALTAPLARLLEKRTLRCVGRGTNRIATIHVDDVVAALLLSARHPDAHRRTFDAANDEHVTQREFLEGMARVLELPLPRGRVPAWLAYGAAGALELLSELTGRPPWFSLAMVGLMAADQRLDTSRLREALGWCPAVCFTEGIRRMCECRGDTRA